MITEKIGLNDLKKVMDVSEAIRIAESFNLEYPKKPHKPTIKHNHTANELIEYSELYKKYMEENEVYRLNKNEYDNRKDEVNSKIEEYIKYAAHLEGVPEQYQKKIYGLAWEDGHAYGYYEVYLKLLHLVEIFLD